MNIKANYGDYMINAKEIHSYLQNHTINDACKHFNCSFKELVNYTKINEPSEENTPKYDMRYIYKRNGFYYILKSINGEYKYFKGSNSLKEAVEFRDKLIENNWRDDGQLGVEELDKLIEDGTKVDLVLIDPPYNINKEKGWDNRKKEEYIEFMGEVFTKVNTILRDNGTLIWFHSEIPLIAELMMWIRNNLPTFCYNSFIVCDKGDFRALSWKNPTDKNNLRSWFNTCEYILVYTKGDELYRSVDKTGWDRVRLDVNNFQNLRKYAYDMLCYIGGGTMYERKQIERDLGHRKAEHFFYCEKKTYEGDGGSD